MEQEPGDEYLRRLATFIRTNEKALAEAGVTRRRRVQRPAPSEPSFNPLGWFGLDASNSPVPPPKPVILSTDVPHLFYVLMRLEALGYDIGTLDVQIDSPSRPTTYVNLFPEKDKSDTLSLASFRSSFSVVSGLSLGGGWWSRPEPPSLDSELKYIYSSFTKLPALSVHGPERKAITELLADPPHNNALPLDTFKNLQSLECLDIDPRTLLGWDRLAESLRSLKIRKSGLEDVSDIFIGAVVDDQARRAGSASRKRRRIIPRGSMGQPLFQSTKLPDTVMEDENEDESGTGADGGVTTPVQSTELSPLKWAFLKHLALPDNALTFFPTDPLPYLTSLTHLDLSSNLLVSVPPGLGALYNLVSLNLADNMIDSVLGIYQNLGQVLYLNLSHNRLESICGLERLHALERVDLRTNLVEESAEIGRLAPLPNIAEVWVEGNPFTEIEEGYRIICFDYFWKEGKTIKLDGTEPGYYEKRNLTVAPPQQMSSSRPISTVAASPPVVAVGHAHAHSHSPATASPLLKPTEQVPTPPSSNPSPHLGPVAAVGVSGKSRRKKAKRIVDLDGSHSEASSRSASHARVRSEDSHRDTRKGASLVVESGRKWGQVVPPVQDELATPTAQTSRADIFAAAVLPSLVSPSMRALPSRVGGSKGVDPSRRSRHSRYQTEYLPSSTADISTVESGKEASGSPPSFSRRGSATISSKSGRRQARVSASVYEPSGAASDGEGEGEGIRDNAEAYRRRIEALKADMGDRWLNVFSQSEMRSPL
ncbi:hypothetical protein BDQ12DRAFT_673317 [Crucibulum laeve]|uniref:Uncharacterized protein n=1 Tax=Crucibulum laeve TaxID=68775 RepID=A0A5C3MTC8_9AGAR|nr:hypothetical protein BDQ12DRAFT_673317 [Crucibulum laeve]